jgi:hypothetical protein
MINYACLLLMFAGCRRLPDQPETVPLFTVSTNLVENGGIRTKFTLTNGITFVSENDRAELVVGGNGITVFFDPTTRRVLRMVHEQTSPAGDYWLSDINGDAVVDMRRNVQQSQREVFMGGSWTPTQLLGTNWFIVRAGKTNRIEFDRQLGSWGVAGD